MAKKSVFQIFDDMNQDDIKNGSELLGLIPDCLGADKTKKGAIIKMAAPGEIIMDLLDDKRMCVLLIIDKKDFYKRQKEAENAEKSRQNT